MRTIATTFDTRGEAETASRRLQGIGVDPELIQLRDLAGAAEPDAAVRSEGPTPDGGHAGGIFLSAKVAPEQVAAASEILKGVDTGDEAPPASAIGAGEMIGKHSNAQSVAPVGVEPPLSFGGAPADAVRPRESGPARVIQDQVRQGSQGPAGQRPSKGSGGSSWKRPFAIFCVAVLAAFIVGLLMGQLA